MFQKYSLAYISLQESLRMYPHQSMALHYLGSCLFHMKRMEEAINSFEAALLLKPKNTDVMQSLARVYA